MLRCVIDLHKPYIFALGVSLTALPSEGPLLLMMKFFLCVNVSLCVLFVSETDIEHTLTDSPGTSDAQKVSTCHLIGQQLHINRRHRHSCHAVLRVCRFSCQRE